MASVSGLKLLGVGNNAKTVKGDGSEYLDQSSVNSDPYAAAVHDAGYIAYIGLRATGSVVKLMDLYEDEE